MARLNNILPCKLLGMNVNFRFVNLSEMITVA